MRDRDRVPADRWRGSPPREGTIHAGDTGGDGALHEFIAAVGRARRGGTPASATLAWRSTSDADWLGDVRSYDGFVRHRRSG